MKRHRLEYLTGFTRGLVTYLIPRSLQTRPGSWGPLGNRVRFQSKRSSRDRHAFLQSSPGGRLSWSHRIRDTCPTINLVGVPIKLLDLSLWLTLCMYAQDTIEIVHCFTSEEGRVIFLSILGMWDYPWYWHICVWAEDENECLSWITLNGSLSLLEAHQFI